MNFKEKYSPRPMGVNATTVVEGVELGHFIATTAGTITVVNGGITYLNAHPVAAGSFLPLVMGFSQPGTTVTLAGGASGCLLA